MPSTERPRIAPLALLTFAAVGAGTSALLLHEYLVPGAGACGPEGGCATVRDSAYASLLGIPLPALGLAFFSLFGASVLVPALRARRLPAWLGGIGSLGALGLLAIQALVLGAWCPFCVVVDLCALSLGLAVVLPSLTNPQLTIRGSAAAGIVAVGLAVPMAIGVVLRPVPPPPTVEPGPASIATAPTEGRATIVEFIDFQCPFCRRQHATLAKILDSYGERVRVQTHHLPLERIHPQAREAARVACCAEEQGKDEAVIHALMQAEDLSPAGCRETAEQAGVDGEALSACLESERPDERLQADAAQAKANGVRSLPTVFIGGQRFQGARDEATLRNAIERALAGQPTPT
ncbi:MAG: vitamin K epoxide reductase family protein [Myxococcota bacterium]